MVSKKTSFITLLMVTFFTMSLFCVKYASSQSLKIGSVDLQKVFRDSKQGKEKLKIAEKLVREKQAKIKELGLSIQDMEKELREKELVISDTAKADMEESIASKAKQFKRYREDALAEIQKFQTKNKRELLTLIIGAIKDYGKQEGFTLIVNSLDDNFLYLDNSLDVTDSVINILNRQ